MSSDSHLVWSGSWDLINLSKKDISGFPLSKIPDVCNSIQAVNDPTNKNVYKLAVAILHNLEQGICRCSAYSASPRLLPTEEEERQFVSIETKKEDTPWELEFVCRCNACGNKYHVHVNHGYHYPMANWVKRT
ncbi:hypothetical protein [Vibrio sp. N418]|uniref:hypothetical protein n=1 Tax=Vibrio sp. (strain N418) TaxID=701176 RepID=UPI0011119606|nr:hypothetical protein [Vibrio sp. N418]